MNSPPSSLASLLAYPPAEAAGQPAPAEEGDPAVLMTYLRDHYDSTHENDPNAANRVYLPNNGDYRGSAQGGRVHEPAGQQGTAAPAAQAKEESLYGGGRAPSPIDTSIVVPDRLSNLVEVNPPNAPYVVQISSAPEDTFTSSVSQDRGEMGGKRRKAPHERAGWKEILEEEARGDKRTRSSKVEPEATENFREYDQVPSNSAAGPSSAAEAATGDGEDKNTKRAKPSKESRAEQNRKAQQIFRRKREEKIKQLESDSVALAGVRQRLAAAEARLTDLALDLEAKTIEATALRSAVTTLAVKEGTSAVRPDGTLVLSDAEYDTRDKTAIGAADGRLTVALDHLVKSSRNVAKMNRARRAEESRH